MRARSTLVRHRRQCSVRRLGEVMMSMHICSVEEGAAGADGTRLEASARRGQRSRAAAPTASSDRPRVGAAARARFSGRVRPCGPRASGVFLVAFALVAPGPGWGNENVPSAGERDVQCLEKAQTQTEINDCFRRSSTVEARNLATLLSELADAIDAPRAHALMRNQDDWKRQVVAQCQWESAFFEGGSVASGVLSRCVAEHTAARVRRLKIFLCEGAGLTGPCEASERY